ncbi:MAG TPA: peptidoglycan-associated lipoprotein Pal [Verrucomicrobiae bacterium]|nr:peptidoglycan-associated lipoprotein Pal [Verrucomicrobiae bacterium]
MKLTKITHLLVLGTALTITAVGCKTHPLNPTPLQGSRQHIGDASGPGNGMPIGQSDINANPISTTNGIPPNENDKHKDWVEDPGALKAQTIYFDFDKSSIKTGEQSKLDDVANYLKSNPAAAVKVEGNCDERGTEEYNRSLGERRALAAREYLVNLGIEASRVDTISFGEDKPVDPSHNEAAWSKNRRDDFVVLTPPKM